MADPNKPTRQSTPAELAEAHKIIQGLGLAAQVRPLTASFALPSIVKATTTSAGKYMFDGMTLTHIATSADEAVLAAIIGDSTEYVVGTALITDLPPN